ncbi:4-phosphoerythronate dehydrogenase PdxB [Pistricoccus aurantiacus]|uniref:Erythronate-4-phosphate dehydrogenase n=1 Tax=Pistricoccus aurantiacus TaxID=1883414 RepID=A0A5B8SVD9_9GAMM|nr:4-phosphoerythronate dehydrogenase PdxB [Pistricoccus aurantiacus]QEA39455.1 4-phosphoerythronate dehydrogenase PdxB [Pistricoccus aurantiacus]
MRILVDANIPFAQECFGELGTIKRLPGREIDTASVGKVDILILRSVTRVDEALLDGSKVRFVGTCTIGTDHIDLAVLEARGIGFANAPGCNAQTVVDYVLSCLLLAAEHDGKQPDQRRVGIVGAGNVGRRLYRRLSALGIDCLVCDPPRAVQPRAETEGSEGFVDLDTLIAECDTLCLHTPLVEEGPYPTRHLLDERCIEALMPGTLLISAGRGDCLDGAALKQRLIARNDLIAMLDVWENEPAIDDELARRVTVATPHIAGYSLDGKLRGTYQVYQALMQYLGLPCRLTLDTLSPPPALVSLTLDAGLDKWQALRLCTRACYDVRQDHLGLSRYQATRGMAVGFDAYRAEYPLRREFSTLEVKLKPGAGQHAAMLEAAGFRVRETA